MSIIYLACLLFSIGLFIMLKLFDVKNSSTQFITLLIMIISNLGFYFISIAGSIDEALVAVKITYIGGVFLPAFYMFTCMEICHIELNRLVYVIILLVQSSIYGVVAGIGKNELFYRYVTMHEKDGNIILDKVYGPLHMLYPLTMYIYLLASIVIIIYSLVKKKSVNRRGVVMMIVCLGLTVAAYVIEKAIGLEYEIMPIAYDVFMCGALIPIYDSNLYTAYENTEIINEQFEQIGFLTFDKKRKYKGCDEFMARVFPELANYHIGEKIVNCSDELKRNIDQIAGLEEKYKNSDKKEHLHIQLRSFLLNDKCYTGSIHIVCNAFGRLKGYTIEIRDSTEHYRALELKEHYNEELAREVKDKTKRIRDIQQKIILGMAQMVESRDLSTGGHIKRTSDVVRIFSKKLIDVNLGLDKRFLALVVRTAPMHDIGKIGVDDAVLRKQGRFTAEEYNEMKKHSEIGYHMVNEILSGVEEPDFVAIAENIAHYHHEKIDGSGYPSGLKGEEIPIEARIMALADVFDALVSKRCYKEAFSYDEAFDIIKKDAGTHFDARLAGIFLSCREELEEYYNREK